MAKVITTEAIKEVATAKTPLNGNLAFLHNPEKIVSTFEKIGNTLNRVFIPIKEVKVHSPETLTLLVRPLHIKQKTMDNNNMFLDEQEEVNSENNVYVFAAADFFKTIKSYYEFHSPISNKPILFFRNLFELYCFVSQINENDILKHLKVAIKNYEKATEGDRITYAKNLCKNFKNEMTYATWRFTVNDFLNIPFEGGEVTTELIKKTYESLWTR
jgi:23S rRNA G2445 N2-methylase RlmL